MTEMDEKCGINDENANIYDINNMSLKTMGKTDSIPSFEQSLDDAVTALRLMLENDLSGAYELLQQWSKVSLYHSHVETGIKVANSLLTLEKPKLDDALESCNRNFKLINHFRRKKSLIGSFARMVWLKTENYDDYSEEEIHAEICYGELLVMYTLLTFFGNQSIIALMKGAIRLLRANDIYKECMNILQKRKKWSNEKSMKEYESAVLMGIGGINFICSYLPSKLLNIVQIIGFSGDRTLGSEYILKSAENTNSYRSYICKFLNLCYNYYAEPIFAIGSDLTEADNMNERELQQLPNSAWFLWFKGRSFALKGQIDYAIEFFDLSISKQSKIKQLHNICYWELIWCYALKCDWDSAAKYASILRNQCEWSPATFCYQEATFLYMKMIEEDKPEMHQQISDLFKLVPQLKKHFAGKTIPPEKYVCVSAEKYFKQNEKLFLPAFDLFYIWSIFELVKDNESLNKPILSRINAMIENFNCENEINQKDSIENYYHLLLMKGVCLKYSCDYTSAAECFNEIMKNENKITRDTFIPPEAALELGIVYMKINEYDRAKHWLKKAQNYKGYYFETVVNFRIHRVLQLIENN